MARVGIIGLGRMGTALAQRLEAQGQSVMGWTRSGRTIDGIASAPDLATLVAACDSLILSLLDDDAAAQVLDDLLRLDLTGKEIIETSTIVPAITQSRAEAVTAAGATLVDAPISGGPEMVLAGTCGIFLGGSDEAAARAAKTLTPITEKLFHVGPLGAGLVMKAINNGMLQTYFAGLVELLPMAREAGLPLETVLNILCAGPAGMPMVKARIPRITGQDDSVGFALKAVKKDTDVIRRMLEAHDLPTPVMSHFEALGAEMLAAGFGESDVAQMVRRAYLERGKG